MLFKHDENISCLLASLGIGADLLARKQLPFYPDARELVIAETGADGREYLLVPEAAQAWQSLKLAAQQDGIVVGLVSAFRDIERQADIIRAKIARGMPMETILSLSAPPGYSEHHTGRAVDINTPGCAPTEEEFEHTDAFGWLMQHAGRFRFTLSYPRANSLGFIYEPWHWCYQPLTGTEQA